MRSRSAVQERLRNGARKISYGGLWGFFKSAWVGLPDKCTGGGVFDVYSAKCWTPGSGQCGTYKREGDCYNREHSWPKSWWGRDKNPAYSDVFHVMPSDGYVNGRRSSFPLGEVNSATFRSSEGNEVGASVTPGYSGTVFEPTDKVKGLLARNQLYMTVRYSGEFSCCSNDAVIGDTIRPWFLKLMLQWNSAFPPQPWEVEFNNRAQKAQGNRNPFIDYPELGDQLLR